MDFLIYCFALIAFYFLIFRSVWYEIARFTNYILIKILNENKKYKSKSKKVNLKRSSLQNFFYKDISSFLYEKEARTTGTLVAIILLIDLFFNSISKFNFESRDTLGKMMYPVDIAFLYSNIFCILLCWDILLFLINKFLILKNKKSSNEKELYTKQNLLKTDIKDKVYDIVKGILFVFSYLIFFVIIAFLYKILFYNLKH